MASSSTANADARDTRSYGEFVPNRYPDIEMAPIYDLMNGDPQQMQPYLARSTIPTWAKWVPIANLPSGQAFATVDASVRSHVYHVLENKPASWSRDKAIKAGAMLGIARSAMLGLFKTTTTLINPEEMAEPVLRWAQLVAATDTEPAKFGLQILVPPPPPVAQAVTPPAQTEPAGEEAPARDEGNRSVLSRNWVLPESLEVFMKLLLKAGMTVLPVQGHNLMVEGHHYLSEKKRPSNRAFRAVEVQLFVNEPEKDLLSADEDFGRDLLWHKSGHPVLVSYKTAVATSETVKQSLIKLDLGAAAVRLPACESELKGLGAYKGVAEAVKPAIEGHGGVVDCSVFQELVDALTLFPIGVPGAGPAAQAEVAVGGYYDQAGNRVATTTIRSRAELISYAKALMARNQHTVAQLFGFYVSMREATQGESYSTRRDSLLDAKSLDKLRSECMASFGEGRELHRDVVAMRAKARREGTFKAPPFVIS